MFIIASQNMMQNFTKNDMEYGRLIDFISDEFISKSKYLDLLEFYFPYKLYLYGDQYKVNRENKVSVAKEKLKDCLRELYCIKKLIFSKDKHQKGINVLSGAYFGVNKYLNELGFNTVYGPWLINGTDRFLGDIRYIHHYYAFKRRINALSFQESLSDKCDKIVANLIEETKDVMQKHNIRAYIGSSTHAMENRIPLKAAQELGIPTFVFLHGLPFPFYYEEANRADYLIVWSEKIKQNFLKLTNYPENRILVAGHPLYQSMPHKCLRNSLDDILIITPSSEAERHQDRGNMVYYLLTVEKILKGFGVKKVRFRPHPHEDANWYLKFIDNNFFAPDTGSLKVALEKSTLVIGTLSTIVVEALFYGVNYILYDPLDDNQKNIYGHTTVPPFDGSDKYLPVAQSPDELIAKLNEKACVDTAFFHEYINTPFDISFIKELI